MWLLCQYFHKRKEVFCFSFEFEPSGVQPYVGSLFTKEEQKKKYLILLSHMQALFWRYRCTETAGNSRASLTVEFSGFLQTLIFTKQNEKSSEKPLSISSSSSSRNIYPVPVDKAREASPLLFPLKDPLFSFLFFSSFLNKVGHCTHFWQNLLPSKRRTISNLVCYSQSNSAVISGRAAKQAVHCLNRKHCRVQFSSRWYLSSENPICAPLLFSEASPTLPLKHSRCSSDWRWPSLVLLRKIVQRFLFSRLSPPGDRWSDALGFVHTGSVSSISTLQTFRDSSHLLCQSICSVISLYSSMCRAVHPQEFSNVRSTIYTCQSGLPIPLFTFCGKLTESVRIISMCGLTVTSWGNPAEGMDDCFHRHCQAGVCTVSMVGGRTLLDTEAPPWLSFGFLNHQCTLWDLAVCWFLKTLNRAKQLLQISVRQLDRKSFGRPRFKPVLNWANVCSPEHTSDTSTNYDSFLNWTFSSLNMVRTVQTLLHSQLACNEMQASARTCGRRAADSMIENVG